MSLLDELRRRISKGIVDNSLNKCSRWAENRIHTPPPYAGPLTFEKFPWQREILNCMEPFVTIQKAAQMGFSVAGIFKALYMVKERGVDVLYILPTAGVGADFAKARIDQIVMQSPELREMWAESNVGLKITHERASLYIRGSKSEANLVSVPVGLEGDVASIG